MRKMQNLVAIMVSPKVGAKKGESVNDAAKRELCEESGLEEKKHRLKFLPKTLINEVNGGGNIATQYLVAVLPSTADEFNAINNFTFDVEEITWVRFLPIDQAMTLLKPARGKALQDALIASKLALQPAVETVKSVEIGKPGRLNIQLISVSQATENTEYKMSTVPTTTTAKVELKESVNKTDKTDKVSWAVKKNKLKKEIWERKKSALAIGDKSGEIDTVCNCQLCLSIGLGSRPPEARLRSQGKDKIKIKSQTKTERKINSTADTITTGVTDAEEIVSGRLKWLSKAASWLLRHQLQTVEFNLGASDEGYVAVDTLLKTATMTPRQGEAPVTLDEIKLIVAIDDKTRFKLKEVDGIWFIRANQGHSKPKLSTDQVEAAANQSNNFLCDEKMLTKITTPLPVCVHGTTRSALKLIMESGGLSAMGRLHVHFASSADTAVVKSGMRKDCSVKIYLNMALAMADGIEFFLSDNGVILSRGAIESVTNGGFIPRKYFSSIQTDRKKSAKADKSVSNLVDE